MVDGHELLVLERQERALEARVEDGPAGEVPRRPAVLRRAENIEAARPIDIAGGRRATLEDLARQVGVALRVECDRRVTGGLPVLARERVPATRKGIRDGRVVPRPAAVGAPRTPARAVAAAIVVVARDQVVRVARIDRERLLVLGLTAALEVGVAEVEAVLVDLDVRALV